MALSLAVPLVGGAHELPAATSGAQQSDEKGEFAFGVLAATSYQTITSVGPLESIALGNELSCQIDHSTDEVFQFYPPSTTPGDCGTFVSIGGTLYAPDFSAHGGTATGGLGSRTPFTPTAQTEVAGTGTATDPYEVFTTVDVGDTGLQIEQRDSYVVGTERYRTDVTITNTSQVEQSGVLYRAGDCFLGGSDFGFGVTETFGTRKTVACSKNANNTPPSRIERWSPITGGNRIYQAHYSELWQAIGTKTGLPDTCECEEFQDNGAGISWDFTLPASASRTFSHFTTFTPDVPDPEPDPDPLALKIVVLGDSYSAGNGAGSYYGPMECLRSHDNWAEQYADSLRSLGYAVTLVNRACSGSITDHIQGRRMDTDLVQEEGEIVDGNWSIGDPGLKDAIRRDGHCVPSSQEESYDIEVKRVEFAPSLNATLVDFDCDRTLKRQDLAVGADTDLVLMTTGGNDSNFGNIVRRCFLTGFAVEHLSDELTRDPVACEQEVGEAMEASGPDLITEIGDALRALGEKMRPDARIVLANYPYLECCPTGYTFDGYEVGHAVRALGDRGDFVQREAVSRANDLLGSEQVMFVDGVKTAFVTHEPYGHPDDRNPQRWMYEIERGFGIGPFPNIFTGEYLENYHPNPTGHEEWAKVLFPFDTFGASGNVEGDDVDVAFVVDTSAPMSDIVANLRIAADSFVGLLDASTESYRLALVTYRDHPSHTGIASDYPARLELEFTEDGSAFVSAMNAVSAGGGGDVPNSTFSGLIEGIGLDWRPGVKKMVFHLSEAPPHQPEPVTGYTALDVVTAALEVDPAEVYVVDVGGAVPPALAEIAAGSGGSVFSVASSSEVSTALENALDHALAKPFAWAAGPYIATVGTEVTLDGSGSFDADGTVVSYEWDVDGDGDFDSSSAESTLTHTFSQPFEGLITLRVTDDEGRTSLATTRASASTDGDGVAASADNCPDELNHSQSDFDRDGVGDVCDSDPGFYIAVGPGPTCEGLTATIVGTNGRDTLVGTPGRDVIVGLGGDDVISGDAGTDVICGGDGNDEIDSGDDADLVDGGAGNDKLRSGNGNDRVNAQAGNDDVDTGNGDDVLAGGDGTNKLVSGNGDDHVRAGAGDDEIFAGNGVDVVRDVGGANKIDAGNQNDTVTAGDGADEIRGGDGDDTLNGGGGNDRLFGGNHNDTLRGGAGDDRLAGGAGNDTLDGQDGRDACTEGETRVNCEP